MLTGSSVAATVLAMVSAASSSVLPTSPLSRLVERWLCPASSRAQWGARSPTKLISPVPLTTVATTIVANVSIRKRFDGLFHVVSFHKHTCDCIFPTVKASWVKKLAKDTLAGTPTIGTKKLKETLHSEHGVVVKMWTVQRGLTHARQSLANDSDEYGKLHLLFAQLTHTDEATVTDVLLDGDSLKRLFLCL